MIWGVAVGDGVNGWIRGSEEAVVVDRMVMMDIVAGGSIYASWFESGDEDSSVYT